MIWLVLILAIFERKLWLSLNSLKLSAAINSVPKVLELIKRLVVSHRPTSY